MNQDQLTINDVLQRIEKVIGERNAARLELEQIHAEHDRQVTALRREGNKWKLKYQEAARAGRKP